MSAFLWFAVCWWLLNIVCSVAMIGKPRKAATPGGAAVAVLVYLAFIAWALKTGGLL